MSDNRDGRLFVLSAPSGSGKSTVKNLIVERRPGLVYSVSFTTRAPRPGEVDGRDYNFVSAARFKEMIETGDFLEWAEVFGNFYGTGKPWVKAHLRAGCDVIADIDVAGAVSVRKIMPEAIFIFMVPPTIKELRQRLKGRKTESSKEIAHRLKTAKIEIGRSRGYDFLLVNDQLEQTVSDLEDIIENRRGLAIAEAKPFWDTFFAGSQAPAGE
jgi:guanylate kinase